jgi:hypothetical protein
MIYCTSALNVALNGLHCCKSIVHWWQGILKYSHNDAVQCLAYNPISHQGATSLQ